MKKGNAPNRVMRRADSLSRAGVGRRSYDLDQNNAWLSDFYWLSWGISRRHRFELNERGQTTIELALFLPMVLVAVLFVQLLLAGIVGEIGSSAAHALGLADGPNESPAASPLSQNDPLSATPTPSADSNTHPAMLRAPKKVGQGGSGQLTSGPKSTVPLPKQNPTTLYTQPLKAAVVGQKSSVKVLLVQNGHVVSNATVDLSIDADRSGHKRVRTDSLGMATFTLAPDLAAGDHTLSFEYAGTLSNNLGSSSTTTRLTVTPAQLRVDVSPAFTGIAFQLTYVGPPVPPLESAPSTVTFRSGADGVAATALPRAGLFRLDILDTDETRDGHRVQFVSWSDKESSPSRDVKIPGDTHFKARFADTFASHLTLDATSVSVGEKGGVLTARLTGPVGEPIPGRGITFLLGGEDIGRAQTDTFGTAQLKLRIPLSAGDYEIRATFDGLPSAKLDASEATSRLRVGASGTDIQTVPALPGMKFAVTPPLEKGVQPASFVVQADASGIAHFDSTEFGTYTVEVLGLDADSEVRARFRRWQDDTFAPARQVQAVPGVRLQVGFEVSYLVNHNFVDDGDRPIDSSRVTHLSITSTQGDRIELDGGEPVWLVGQRVTRGSSGLEPTQVEYSVESVMMDGSNVVNRSQQRFFATETRSMKIKVMLYSLRVTAVDRLFRSKAGSGLTLRYPDGRVEHFNLRDTDAVELYGLARGQYAVTVEGTLMKTTTPIALSRDQDVQLDVITRWDAYAAVALAVFVIVGLPVLGRFRLFQRREREASAAA